MSMNKVQKKNNKKFKVKEIPHSTLSSDEHIRAIANIIIDRILEESSKGTLPFNKLTRKEL